MPQPEQLAQSINAIGERIMAYKEKTDEKQAELQARLLELEQKAISGGLSASKTRTSYASNPVAQEFSASEQVQSFRAGMPTTGQMKVTQGLRAALTNTGRGDTGSTSYPTAPERAPGVVGVPAARLSLLDVLPVLPVHATTFEYVQIDGLPVAGYQLLEGGEKAESTVTPELKRAEIATIAHHTTASVQVLADNGDLEHQISQVLSTGCKLKLEAEVLNGAGGTGEVSGLLSQATAVTLTAAAPADRIGEAVTGLQADGWEANLIVMHPADWFTIASIRDESGNGQYLLGSPRDPAPAALWGVPIAMSANMPRGQALVMDISQVAVLDREEVTVEASRYHGTNFTKNLVTLLAELRAGLAVFAPSAVRSLQLVQTP